MTASGPAKTRLCRELFGYDVALDYKSNEPLDAPLFALQQEIADQAGELGVVGAHQARPGSLGIGSASHHEQAVCFRIHEQDVRAMIREQNRITHVFQHHVQTVSLLACAVFRAA